MPMGTVLPSSHRGGTNLGMSQLQLKQVRERRKCPYPAKG